MRLNYDLDENSDEEHEHKQETEEKEDADEKEQKDEDDKEKEKEGDEHKDDTEHKDEDEHKDEEHKGEDEHKDEEEKHVEKNPNWPKVVHYCPICTVPPEYCSFYSSNLDECKDRLKQDNPRLYGAVYEGREDEASEENKGKKKKNKANKKTKEFSSSDEIKVVKLKRGGNKIVTEINGLDGFGLNLKDFVKKMGKKFA